MNAGGRGARRGLEVATGRGLGVCRRFRRAVLAGLGVAAWAIGGVAPAHGLEQRQGAAAEERVRGRVTDAETGAPVVGGLVAWTGGGGAGSGEVLVGADGWFESETPWGPGGTVEVSALGYRTRTVSWDDAALAQWRIALVRDPLALEEIVVTADGRPRRRSEVALHVASVGAAEIRAAGAASADRLLARLPGVQVGGGVPTGSSLSIRGIGGPRVLVLLDGQPAGGALIENRDLSRMSMTGVDRIEVVKGPLSSLYGSDAVGGVVNIVTRAPAPGFRVDARAASGGAGRREAEATASGGRRLISGGSLVYRVGGSWRQEDRVPGVADRETAFARVWDLRSSLRFATRRWVVRGDASLIRERQRWPVGGGFSGFNDNAGVSGWIEARRQAGRGEWIGRIFAHDYDHLYRSARGSAPIEGSGAPEQQERLAKATAAYAATWGRHRFDVGVEGALRGIRSPEKLLEDRAEDRQLELYVQDAWRLGGLGRSRVPSDPGNSGGSRAPSDSGNWDGPGNWDGSGGLAALAPGNQASGAATVLTAGARITRNSRWGSTVSPSLGAVVAIGDRVRVRGAVARGFRAPSFKELAWNFVNVGGGYVLQGFADLEPERSWNASGGVQWHPRTGVRAGVEFFANRVRNLIESGFVGHAPSGLAIYSPRNVADAVTRGFELDLRAIHGRGGEIVAAYAYLDARSLRPDLPLDRQAKHSARARAAWTAGRLRLDATGHITGQAPIVGVGPDGAPARVGTQGRFAALDLSTTLEIADGRFALIAGVDNVFNAQPDGWQGFVERRFRVSGQVAQSFRRTAARAREP